MEKDSKSPKPPLEPRRALSEDEEDAVLAAWAQERLEQDSGEMTPVDDLPE